MSKLARSDEPKVNQVQIKLEIQMIQTKKGLTLSHLPLIWNLDFDI